MAVNSVCTINLTILDRNLIAKWYMAVSNRFAIFKYGWGITLELLNIFLPTLAHFTCLLKRLRLVWHYLSYLGEKIRKIQSNYKHDDGSKN